MSILAKKADKIFVINKITKPFKRSLTNSAYIEELLNIIIFIDELKRFIFIKKFSHLFILR